MAAEGGLVAPIDGAEHSDFAGIGVDVVTVGNARVKRLVYHPGMRWSVDVKPLVGTERCMHAHVGFLAQGRLCGEYEDGCGFDFEAPVVVVIEPGHDAWVEGDEDTVLIQFDFGVDTLGALALPDAHRHA